MTLLEPLVALVILGLSATGFLQAFQGASRSILAAEDWLHAVGYAEAGMEETKLGGGAGATPFPRPVPRGFSRTVSVQPWEGAPGVELVTVTVTLPGGGTFSLQRLARRP